jgi:hypothetical protein
MRNIEFQGALARIAYKVRLASGAKLESYIRSSHAKAVSD